MTTGNNYNFFFFYLIDKAMFPVDSTGPATGKLKTERFGFSGPCKGGSPNLFQKRYNSLCLPFIGLQPIAQIVKRGRREGDIHSPRASMGVLLPVRDSSRDCINRAALAGLERRYSLSMMDS
jgi:hypothetical protein